MFFVRYALLYVSVFLLLLSCTQKTQYTGWTHYKGSPDALQYAALSQIDTNNVSSLQVAWLYHTGDADTVHNSQIQCNPIAVNGTLYGTTAQLKLFAIDAATGKEKWVFNPFDSIAGAVKSYFFILNNCRGVAWWGDGSKEKIYYTAGSHLYCIDAKTGRPVPGFADSGRLDLHEGLDRDVSSFFVTATSPPVVYQNLLIIGTRVDEGQAAAPGHIRAYDVHTGQRKWIFHTIPQPGEEGYNTWKDTAAYKTTGGANAWGGFSLDEKRGLIFAGTGSASYDFYGGRRQGSNLFANSVLALHAATGKKAWHFQYLHHDVWDRDLPTAPVLVNISRNGKAVDAALQITKTGEVYVFDRESGKSLFPINEEPVPNSSELNGEELWPTQPRSAIKPFVRQSFTEKDINPLLSAAEYGAVKKRWQQYNNNHLFNPPSLKGTIVLPGLDGGGEWGGPSVDPETAIAYINANEMAWVVQAVNLSQKPAPKENYIAAGQRLYRTNCMTCHGPDKKGAGNFPTLLGISKKYSRNSFDTLLQSGRRMMPAFRQLTNDERKALASYVLGATDTDFWTYPGGKEDTTYKLLYGIAGYQKFLSPSGRPALSPPWGTLSALNINTGQWLWQIPLGIDTAYKNGGSATGTENYGAAVVTKGGLLFIAATKDGMLRAFNKRTGKLLWQTKLPAAAFATPAVYELNGRQYVVIACGGGKLGTPSGDSYVAYALPER